MGAIHTGGKPPIPYEHLVGVTRATFAATGEPARRENNHHLKWIFEIEGPLHNQSSVCVPILRALPDWFGIEKAILDYEREIEQLPTFLAKSGGSVMGFLSLKQHNPFSAEIYVMAVRPEAQRCGMGRALVQAAEAHARELRRGVYAGQDPGSIPPG